MGQGRREEVDEGNHVSDDCRELERDVFGVCAPRKEGGGDDVVVGEGVRGAGSRWGERAKDVALAKDAGPRVGGAECRDLRVWVR